MSEKQPQSNPFRDLDELKNRLPFLWELQTQRPAESPKRQGEVEPFYSILLPKPAA
jgi:hypothetical protein